MICRVIALMLGVGLASPMALAGPSDFDADLKAHLVGNAYHTVLHEVGHLLIDKLGLPVLGQEEDAADNFATLTLLEWDTPEADRALLASARADYLRHDYDGVSLEPEDYFYEHDLDVQRASRVLCHMIGLDPPANRALARRLHLNRENKEICKTTFEVAANGWDKVLAPHRLKGETNSEIKVHYRQARRGMSGYRDILRDEKVLEKIAGYLEDNFVLPKGVRFVARSCGEANAFYDADISTVTFCYEYLEELEDYYEPED